MSLPRERRETESLVKRSYNSRSLNLLDPQRTASPLHTVFDPPLGCSGTHPRREYLYPASRSVTRGTSRESCAHRTGPERVRWEGVGNEYERGGDYRKTGDVKSGTSQRRGPWWGGVGVAKVGRTRGVETVG